MSKQPDMTDKDLVSKENRSKLTAWASLKYLAMTGSVLLNVVLVGYYGFYGHRTKVNNAIITQYELVQQQQQQVYNTLVATIPSNRNEDAEPTKSAIDDALQKLDGLQHALSKMNTNSRPLDTASADYKDAIGELTRAIISMDYMDPPSLSMAQSQFKRWDVSAQYFKNAFDDRTTSFWRTVGGVI